MDTGKVIALTRRMIKKEFEEVGPYHYVGSVASVDLLPTTGNKTGDVYNVGSTLDGGNYAWNGTAWDKLGDNAGVIESSSTRIYYTAHCSSLSSDVNKAGGIVGYYGEHILDRYDLVIVHFYNYNTATNPTLTLNGNGPYRIIKGFHSGVNLTTNEYSDMVVSVGTTAETSWHSDEYVPLLLEYSPHTETYYWVIIGK